MKDKEVQYNQRVIDIEKSSLNNLLSQQVKW